MATIIPLKQRNSADREEVDKLLQDMSAADLTSVAVVGFDVDGRLRLRTHASTHDLVAMATALRVVGDQKMAEALG